MSNIISPTHRAALLRIARARLVLVASCALAVSGIVTCIALAPAFLSVAIPLMNDAQSESVIEQEHSTIYEENKTQSARTRVLVSALEPFVQTHVTSVHGVIARVYALRPQGVEIEQLEYLSAPTHQIHITGTSQAREPVNDFRTVLQKEGIFESVSVPVAALVGALDGRFTMTLTVKEI